MSTTGKSSSAVLSQKDVREAFYYDSDAGELRWRTRPLEHFKTHAAWKAFNTKYSGKLFGAVKRKDGTPYRQGSFKNRHYIAHRLVFLYVFGYVPATIDHIDGNSLNNRIANMREATDAENSRNKKRAANSISGVTGVSWISRCSKWKARIYVSGKHKHLGYFCTKKEAIDARKSADQRYGYHQNHGRQPIPYQEIRNV